MRINVLPLSLVAIIAASWSVSAKADPQAVPAPPSTPPAPSALPAPSVLPAQSALPAPPGQPALPGSAGEPSATPVGMAPTAAPPLPAASLSAPMEPPELAAPSPSSPSPEGLPTTRAFGRPEVVGRFELGYRGSFITSPGYNPFSTTDYLAGVSMALTRTVVAQGSFSFAPGFAWDHAQSSATARGDATSLVFNRLSVPLEGRLRFGRWGYAFVRAAPGVVALHAQLSDPSAPATLSKTQWLFAVDASGGYAFPIWTKGVGTERVARLWVQGDGGYGWVAEERLNLGPDQGKNPQPASGVDLGPIAMRGAFFRLSVAASF